MNPSEIERMVTDSARLAVSLAGNAYSVETEADVYDMTDPVTRATWTEAGLRLFLAHVREMYGEEFYARITSVQQVQSDVITTSRVLDCATCEGPQPVTDTTRVLGGQQHRLVCGHTVRDWNGAL